MLSKIAKHHDKWVDIVKKLGCDPFVAEDVVQDTYLRLHKYKDRVEQKVITPEGEVNTFYMFVTLRNLLRDTMNIENNYVGVEEWIFEESDDDADMEMEIAYNKFIRKVKEEANSWGSYHSKLFNLYFMTDYTMRDISNGTDIGLTHIYNNLKSYREVIVEKLGEDYQDFLNEDYDKV